MLMLLSNSKQQYSTLTNHKKIRNSHIGTLSHRKSSTVSEVAKQIVVAFPNHNLQSINTGADITYIIEKNLVKIGIERHGDPYSRIFQSLQTFVAQGCDIIISLCRSRDTTTEAVVDLHRHYQYEII
jgi:hypothetical protein